MPPLAATAQLPADTDRVVILVNPKAGPAAAHPRAEQLAQLLVAHGFEVGFFSDLAAATQQANEWHAAGRLRTLVGCGGDGTAAELVNRTVEGVPLTLLPSGTSNLLARYFHLRNDPKAILQTIRDGMVTRVDAGLAGERIFLLMASCGFDAEVVRRLHERRVGHIGFSTYLKPIAEAIWSYPFPEIRVHWNEGGGNRSQGGKEGDTRPPCERLLGVDAEASVPLSARWLFVFNLPCYGGGFRIAPQADGFDGLFDVCSLRRGGWWNGLWYAASVLARQHHRLADCTKCRVPRLRLTSEERVPYQLDGDPGGFLPLDIEMLPGRLTLVIPNAKPRAA